MSLQLTFAEASAIGPRSENQDALRAVTPAPARALFVSALVQGSRWAIRT